MASMMSDAPSVQCMQRYSSAGVRAPSRLVAAAGARHPLTIESTTKQTERNPYWGKSNELPVSSAE
jgi:hypothetical protein